MSYDDGDGPIDEEEAQERAERHDATEPEEPPAEVSPVEGALNAPAAELNMPDDEGGEG